MANPGSPLVLIALGSNLGDSKEILLRAMEEVEALSAGPSLRSSLWLSTPVDCPPGSPSFLNAAMAIHPRSEETPESLLKKLQALEQRMGRRPKQILNEPRALDLDLIAWGDRVFCATELSLPHPRAHLRRFVLAPLSEIVPDFVMPGQTDTINGLLEHLATDETVTCLAPERT